MFADLECVREILDDHALKGRKRIKDQDPPAFYIHESLLGYFSTAHIVEPSRQIRMVTTMTIKGCNMTVQCVCT